MPFKFVESIIQGKDLFAERLSENLNFIKRIGIKRIANEALSLIETIKKKNHCNYFNL